jgi:hypothetical protein
MLAAQSSRRAMENTTLVSSRCHPATGSVNGESPPQAHTLSQFSGPGDVKRIRSEDTYSITFRCFRRGHSIDAYLC